MGAYRLLFSVSVEHAYFSGQVCKTLEFIPAGPSVAVLNNAGLLVKFSESGVSVFYQEGTLSRLRLYAEDGLSLVFKVFSKDPNFFRYTVPGVPAENNQLYFNNQSVTRDAIGKQMLHSDPSVTDQAWAYTNADPFQGMLDRKDYFANVAFVLQMFIADDEQGLCSERLAASARKFYIRFSANQTYWKYYILGELSKRNVYIADLDNTIQFNNAGSILMPGNRAAVLLQSSTAIPMEEQSSCCLQLRESGSMGDKVLIKRLPNASINQIVGEMMNGKMENISEIFIN
ncbi:hypothetical protein [Nitrosomonas supralitoralis]|uniref:Uncharacterized protein n=1 Tax=Nitrosomonas supralitoralis TaxID=2116706 RepID=A0A2P7NZS7_9PROT|nr:hypothetical protein [Nitrosomonas supralitoralis]PSJ18971.1 hypothetical protein C7H79_00625 [Nitrosomonas supralitoralis]